MLFSENKLVTSFKFQKPHKTHANSIETHANSIELTDFYNFTLFKSFVHIKYTTHSIISLNQQQMFSNF